MKKAASKDKVRERESYSCEGIRKQRELKLATQSIGCLLFSDPEKASHLHNLQVKFAGHNFTWKLNTKLFFQKCQCFDALGRFDNFRGGA